MASDVTKLQNVTISQLFEPVDKPEREYKTVIWGMVYVSRGKCQLWCWMQSHCAVPAPGPQQRSQQCWSQEEGHLSVPQGARLHHDPLASL